MSMVFYYLLTTLLSVGIVSISYFFPDALSFSGDKITHLSANLGLNLLWFTLLVKPIFMILIKYTELKTITYIGLREYLKTFKGRSLKGIGHMFLSMLYFIAALGMKWRRLLGITVFLAIFVHAGIWIVIRMRTDYTLLTQLQIFRILAGYIGLLMLFIGYITSNNFSIRLFKGYWKPIQYSAYIALIFALLHLLFLDPGEYFGQVILLVIYITLKLVEKKKIPFFNV